MSAGKAKPDGEGGPLAVIHVHHIQGMIKKLLNTERKSKKDYRQLVGTLFRK